MAATGKAAVFFGPGKPFQIQELPLPTLEPGAVLIRVTLANICGSDLHFWRGDAPLTLPPDGWIFGHEMTGRVARLGTAITTDSLGQPLPGKSRKARAEMEESGLQTHPPLVDAPKNLLLEHRQP